MYLLHPPTSASAPEPSADDFTGVAWPEEVYEPSAKSSQVGESCIHPPAQIDQVSSTLKPAGFAEKVYDTFGVQIEAADRLARIR